LGLKRGILFQELFGKFSMCSSVPYIISKIYLMLI
jgi:hypothetical protein